MNNERAAEIRAALELSGVALEIAMETEASGWLRELLDERDLMMKVVEAAIEWASINSADSDDVTMDDGVWVCNALDKAVGDWLMYRTQEIIKEHAK